MKRALVLVGSFVEVVESKNKSLIGLKGKVVDETRHMIVLSNKKRFRKEIVRLKVTIDGKDYFVDGSSLVGRPEERIKKTRC